MGEKLTNCFETQELNGQGRARKGSHRQSSNVIHRINAEHRQEEIEVYGFERFVLTNCLQAVDLSQVEPIKLQLPQRNTFPLPSNILKKLSKIRRKLS